MKIEYMENSRDNITLMFNTNLICSLCLFIHTYQTELRLYPWLYNLSDWILKFYSFVKFLIISVFVFHSHESHVRYIQNSFKKNLEKFRLLMIKFEISEFHKQHPSSIYYGIIQLGISHELRSDWSWVEGFGVERMPLIWIGVSYLFAIQILLHSFVSRTKGHSLIISCMCYKWSSFIVSKRNLSILSLCIGLVTPHYAHYPEMAGHLSELNL